jgi:outer membrane protein OmpA-like peptidoglycan-associated protein
MARALPAILKPYLEKKTAEAINGEAHIGAIEIHPFKLTFMMREFSLSNASVKLGWDSLYMDVQLRSIPTWSISLDELRLHNPSFELVLEQKKEGEASAAQFAAEAFLARTNVPVNIKRFIIQSGALEILDKRTEHEKRFGVAPISFSLENFSTQYSSGEGNNYNLQFTGLNGGFFRWNGNLQWSPFLSEGEMEIRGLDIIQLRDFYQEYLPFNLQNASLDLRTHYTMTEEPELGFALKNAKLILNKMAFNADSSDISTQISSVEISPLQISTLDRKASASNVILDSVNTHCVLHKIPDFPSSKLFEFIRHNANAPDFADTNANMFSALWKRITNLPHWQIKIDSMQVKQAQIKIIDSTAATANEHAVNNMQLLFINIANNASDSVNFAGSAFYNSGKLDLQGSIDLFPFRVFANLDISEFPLISLQNYIRQVVGLNLRQGQAAARLNARMRPAADSLQKDTLLFTGNAEIDDLRLLSKNNQEFIRASLMDVKDLTLMFTPRTNWQMTAVNLQAPIMYLTWSANSPANYSQITNLKSEKRERIPFIINQINFNRGLFHLTDKDPATPFSYRITSVHGNLRNLSNQKRNANLSIEGKMAGYAPFSLRGLINLSGKHPKLDLTMKAANQDLVAFSPYSGKYAGYRIAKGQVAFQADYAIENNKMHGNNHVTVQHLTFGEAVKSEDATNFPIRLAAALLSDKDGIMDLDFVISGDLSDPEFSVGSLIWKVIKNLLGKAAAAPFRSLMSLIGSSADPEIIAFSPGSGRVESTQMETLKSLSQALMQRPELQLDVYGNADSTLDGNALRLALPPEQPLNPNALKNLAQTRAQNIKVELVNINASLGERIFVVDDGGLSGHTVNLKIRER